MNTVICDGFAFTFTDALDAFVFDEKDSTKPTFHGVPMKCVDIVVELENAYLFVEVKDFHEPHKYDARSVLQTEESNECRHHFNYLKASLKYKFRDTFLYRYAEGKVDKPVHYICLLSFDNALNSQIKKSLKRELPVGQASVRWKYHLANSIQVLNLATWNKHFPQWPVTRTSVADCAN